MIVSSINDETQKNNVTQTAEKEEEEFDSMVVVQQVQILDLSLIQILNGNTFEPNYYQYLQQFGYTPKVEGRRLFSILAKSSYSEGIRKLQRLYKLPVSSNLYSFDSTSLK